MTQVWTEEEIDYLKECYPKYGAIECAEVLEKSVAAVYQKASQLLIKSKDRWLQEEDSFLIDNYAKLKVHKCAEILNRSVCSIHTRVSRLGLFLNEQDILTQRKLNINRAIKAITKTNLEYVKQIKDTNFIPLEEYVLNTIKILHECKICGWQWKVRPHDIINNQGCPACSRNVKTKFVYYIYFPELDLYKIGITRNYNQRKTTFGHTSELLFIQEYENGTQAWKVEQNIIKWLGNKMVNTGKLKAGNTETFRW